MRGFLLGVRGGPLRAAIVPGRLLVQRRTGDYAVVTRITKTGWVKILWLTGERADGREDTGVPETFRGGGWGVVPSVPA